MMIDIPKGRYWGEGITLVDGCTPCSPGCDHCWSAAQAHRFHGDVDLTWEKEHKWEPTHFNGEIITHPERLERFNTRKPRVFAAWNDLFHEVVPHGFHHDVYARMALSTQHTFLILTKREKVMSKYLTMRKELGDPDICRSINKIPIGIGDRRGALTFPLFNVWHGLTVCNQQEADEKIPIFLQVPGKKFLSIEPSGPIDLSRIITTETIESRKTGDIHKGYPVNCLIGGRNSVPWHIDAVILGGETGPGARPMHPDWVRSVRDQCAGAGVPFFFKQWGEWAIRDSKIHGAIPKNPVMRLGEHGLDTRDLANCTADAGEEVYMQRVGRNESGRELDGRTHDDLPWLPAKTFNFGQDTGLYRGDQ